MRLFLSSTTPLGISNSWTGPATLHRKVISPIEHSHSLIRHFCPLLFFLSVLSISFSLFNNSSQEWKVWGLHFGLPLFDRDLALAVGRRIRQHNLFNVTHMERLTQHARSLSAQVRERWVRSDVFDIFWSRCTSLLGIWRGQRGERMLTSWWRHSRKGFRTRLSSTASTKGVS